MFVAFEKGNQLQYYFEKEKGIKEQLCKNEITAEKLNIM